MADKQAMAEDLFRWTTPRRQAPITHTGARRPTRRGRTTSPPRRQPVESGPRGGEAAHEKGRRGSTPEEASEAGREGAAPSPATRRGRTDHITRGGSRGGPRGR